MDSPVKFIKSNFIRVLIAVDIVVLIFIAIFSIFHSVAETIYSRGIYPVFAFAWGRITDSFRLSFIEFIIIIAVSIIFIRVVIGVYRIIVGHRSFLNTLLHFLKQTFILASIIFAWFYIMWGFNYFREPFQGKVSVINNEKQLSGELLEQTLYLMIETTNNLYMSTLSRRGMAFEDLEEEVDELVNKTVERLDNAKLRPAIKSKVGILNILEMSSYLGVISPFTIESHVSKELFEQELPFILAHEKAHTYGYANETTANYLAFMSCMSSRNPYFRYSAMSQILRYFLGQYRRSHTKEEYEEMFDMIDGGVVNEFLEQQERKKQHKNFVTDTLYKIYDVYLRVNNVSGGTNAYSGVTKWIMQTENIADIIQGNGIEDDEFSDLILDEEPFEFEHLDLGDPLEDESSDIDN